MHFVEPPDICPVVLDDYDFLVLSVPAGVLLLLVHVKVLYVFYLVVSVLLAAFKNEVHRPAFILHVKRVADLFDLPAYIFY